MDILIYTCNTLRLSWGRHCSGLKRWGILYDKYSPWKTTT